MDGYRAMLMIEAMNIAQIYPVLSQAYSAVIECNHHRNNLSINASIDLSETVAPWFMSQINFGWGLPPTAIDDGEGSFLDFRDGKVTAISAVLVAKTVAELWGMRLCLYNRNTLPHYKPIFRELGLDRSLTRSECNFFASHLSVQDLATLLTRHNSVMIVCRKEDVEQLYFSRLGARFDVLLPLSGEPLPDFLVVTNVVANRGIDHNPLSAIMYFRYRIANITCGHHCIGCARLLRLLRLNCLPAADE